MEFIYCSVFEKFKYNISMLFDKIKFTITPISN